MVDEVARVHASGAAAVRQREPAFEPRMPAGAMRRLRRMGDILVAAMADEHDGIDLAA